ncbi:MAG: M23 family metallopeptidase [Clostridiales bacterium]|nr:M23 family metallopeptidase [Clostridiales bacterium]
MDIKGIKITESSARREPETTVVVTELAEPVAEKKKDAPSRGESMFVKIGLCGVALLLALALRSFAGRGEPGQDAREVSAQSGETQEGEDLGALHFVDASHDTTLAAPQKWRAPVQSADMELLAERGTVRFTAAGNVVAACAAGQVLSISEDSLLGRYVRLTHADGVETIYYGLLEVTVKQGQVVQQYDALGTVEAGHSIYVQVLKNGAPQNPQDYILLSIGD